MGKKLEEEDAYIQEAIGWMVTLSSGEAAPEDFAAFETWRAADLRHDKAFRHIENASALLSPLRNTSDPDLMHRTLMTPMPRRHLLGVALAIVASGFGAVQLLRGQNILLADERTQTGERRSIRLADGSTLLLNARSAVDINITASVRHITLHSGQIMVTVARQKRPSPFVVITPFGQVTALGTQFQVRLTDSAVLVDVLESAVQIRSNNNNTLRVAAGHSARLTPDSAALINGRPEAAASWVHGLLEINDEPLSSVIEALRHYHTGIIVLDPHAGTLRVSGIYKLDDLDMTLDALQHLLPLRIERYSRFWIRIEHS